MVILKRYFHLQFGKFIEKLLDVDSLKHHMPELREEDSKCIAWCLMACHLLDPSMQNTTSVLLHLRWQELWACILICHNAGQNLYSLTQAHLICKD